MEERDGTQQTAGEMAEMIRRAKTYDRAAFAELYRLFVIPVYRYLAARVDSAADAEELTQEVFVAALTGVRSLRAEDETGVLGWLLQIARHKLADHLRRRYRRPTSPLEEAESIVDTRQRPEDEAEAGERRAELRRALERLTPEQRDVIICKFILQYDNGRTANLVGKTINAVNQLQHRALASLHRLLAETEKAR